MAILKCKMCGGDIELSADKTFGTCDHCGSTMTFPKVDDEQRANAFNRGNHFRRTGEFDKALAVYERIVQENEDDAEAHWCCALCRFGIEYVEDPNTYEYLPTCHRASFDSFLEDVDYLAAIKHSDGITRRQYQKDAQKIAEVQRGILATSQNEEPFDVFICYKESENDGSRTRDSLLAQDIYYQLTEQGRRVFFSRITLEDKAGTEYEPYIFAALNSAKVMILVTTSAEHANAVWVKNEWSRFLSLMRRDRSKLLLPCYRDMDPYDLPEALSVLQSYDMSKIGFIQDLIRGVNKVLDADKPNETVKETVVVQQQANTNAAPLLKRAFMFLEDGDFARADEFCEQVLNLDPENAEAYLGKLMAELKVNKREQLKNQSQPFDDRSNYIKAVRFGDDSLKEELISCLDVVVTTRQRNMDMRLRFAADIKNRIVSVGGCTIGLKQDGTVVATKYTGDPKDYHGQGEVSEWKDIVAIAAGGGCTIGLKADGTVVATKYVGDPSFYHGQDEVSEWKDIVAIAAGGDCTIGLKADGTVVATKYTGDPEYYDGEDEVSGWKDIIAVTGGNSCTIGLKADGTVVATKYVGDPILYYGQDEVSEWKDIVAIAAGDDCTIGLKADGTVVATKYVGDPFFYHGQDEVSEWKDIVAITRSGCCTIGLKADGTVVATKYIGDSDYYHGEDKVDDWTDIIAVTGGWGCTIGLKADGTVVATRYIEKTECRSPLSRKLNKYTGQCDVGKWELFNNLEMLLEEMQQKIRRRREASELRRQEMEREAERRKQEMEREAERLRQEMEREAERLRQETERKRVERIQELGRLIPDTEKQRQVYQDELANLKGLFTGKRRKELEAQIAEADKRIAALKEELDKLR